MKNALNAMKWVLGGSATLALAAPADAAVREVSSVFYVSKSENKNQVHYAIRLDDRCAPTGASPMFAYWRMLERDARATEPLLDREQPAYGILEQRVLERTGDGGTVRVVLRALPSRPILVTSVASSEGCVVTATTQVGGTRALLTSIHAQLKWPFGVDHLLVSGRAVTGGRALTERIVP
jgi:Domain of unknown function (DUF4833)